MSPNPKVGLALSLGGIVLALLGFAGYVGLLALGKYPSLAMVVAGIVAIAFSYVYTFAGRDIRVVDSEEEEVEMGLMDKIKGVFKKKDKGEKKAAPAKKGAAKVSMDFSGCSIEKELNYAAAKIDEAVAAGKLTEARGDAFRTQLIAIKESGASDDDRRIQVSRVIGGIINGV